MFAGSFRFLSSSACHDSVSNKKVAIKKVHKAFQDERDAKMLLREIKLLRHLSHENIIPLLDIQPPRSREAFDDVYHVTEMMDCDLHRINYSQKLTDDHAQCFIYQIFKALKYIHSAGVIHRDLKPANLLVNKNCDLKVRCISTHGRTHSDMCRLVRSSCAVAPRSATSDLRGWSPTSTTR